ncbi:Beta-mannosidase, partial [Pseudolycoriella hygida]
MYDHSYEIRKSSKIGNRTIITKRKERKSIMDCCRKQRYTRVPAEIPGGIYSDLDAAGNVFRNPIYFDYNDVETRWVGRSDWSYSREFIVSSDLLSKTRIVLICEGLDTIAEVYINDVLVGKSVNMFVRYIYDIKDALKTEKNVIRVDFHSPVLYALNQYNSYNAEYGYPVLRTNLNPAFRGEDKAQMIRKMQASFSWDWGPSYPNSGIWQDIYIEGRNEAVIRDVMIFTSANREDVDETGFRTVKLVEDPVYPLREDFGNFFYFKVNGMKIFSKGSNSIPIHVLNERATDEMTEWLLLSAQKLHTNVIRVWGGGIYASDYFYDLADKLGIFIWQDFMFACSMYPVNPEFLATVEEEVYTQVKRLQHHPSLLIWAANNENEGALRDNWYGTESLFETYRADYIKLYVDTVMRNTLILDPSRDCLSSSPTNGKKTMEEGWVAAWPGDIRYGDAHPYNYKEDNWDWSWMVSRRTRYASEFGYQSFPYVETLKKVSSNFEQWTWFSEWVDHRQRRSGSTGQMDIHDLIKSHLPMPVNPNSTEAFPSMLYMTQITQCMGQKTQTEFYRRNVDKFYVSENGTGYTMGALYWQLNDIWEGCSWSTFASPYKDTNGDVVVEVISESLQQYKSSLRVRIYNMGSLSPILDDEVAVSGDYLTSIEHYRLPAQRLQALGCVANASPCFVYTTMPLLPDNFVFLNYPTDKRYILDITSLFDVTPYAVDVDCGQKCDENSNCVAIGISVLTLLLSVFFVLCVD